MPFWTQADAIRAINYLHEIVNGTVSIFKDFDLQHGAIMLKDIDKRDCVLRAKIAKSKMRAKAR